MKKLTLAFMFCFVFTEDEFFESGVNIGGYGEMHYTNSVDPVSEDDPSTKLDFHRWVMLLNYNWTPEWSLKSELEIEHNMIGGDYGGYVELEQAYINYHNAEGNWGFGAGTILISAGIINETHEPPTFLSVERPSYNKYIIPTTWFGNGAMAYSSFGDFHVKLVLHEDLAGGSMVDSVTYDMEGAFVETTYFFTGLRDGRAKGYKSSALNWTKNLAIHYTGIEGLNLGGSYTFGEAPIDDGLKDNEGGDNFTGPNVNNAVGWDLFEIHGKYNANSITAIFEYGTSNLTHAKVLEGSTAVPDQKTSGYYIHLGYDVSSMMGWEDCRLVPWFGKNMYDINDLIDGDVTNTLMGLTYWPTDQVSFKMDYNMQDSNESKNNTLSLGVGYMF